MNVAQAGTRRRSALLSGLEAAFDNTKHDWQDPLLLGKQTAGRRMPIKSLFEPVIASKRHVAFESLRASPMHGEARRLMDALFAEMGDPDGNFVSEFQGPGFHSRLFELACFAYLKEGGWRIDRSQRGPDFIATKSSAKVVIEAVTSKSPKGREEDISVSRMADPRNEDMVTKCNDELPIRIGSALFSKLQRRYWERPSCRGLPFVLVVGPFHEPGNTVKGKKALVLPIPLPLVQYLRDAMKRSPSEYVFPGSEGKRRPEHTAMEKVFRRILSRAGIVVGYRHICRRCAARREPQVVKVPDSEIRRCPKCNMRMWPSPVPRRMRFHDVRHTTITLLLRLKVPMHLVQRIARHSNIRLTVDTYGHLDVSDLRDALEVLGEATGIVPDALEAELLARDDSLTPGPTGVQALLEAKNEEPGSAEIPEESRALVVGAEHRVRTGDLRLGNSEDPHSRTFPALHSQPKPSVSLGTASPPDPRISHAASQKHESRGPTGVQETLLSVTEVATRLGVCTATIYRLCARGELAHVRILNAIRVAPPDLASFIAKHRR